MTSAFSSWLSISAPKSLPANMRRSCQASMRPSCLSGARCFSSWSRYCSSSCAYEKKILAMAFSQGACGDFRPPAAIDARFAADGDRTSAFGHALCELTCQQWSEAPARALDDQTFRGILDAATHAISAVPLNRPSSSRLTNGWVPQSARKRLFEARPLPTATAAEPTLDRSLVMGAMARL